MQDTATNPRTNQGALLLGKHTTTPPDLMQIVLQEIFSKAPGQALQEGGGSFVGGGPLFEVCTPHLKEDW